MRVARVRTGRIVAVFGWDMSMTARSPSTAEEDAVRRVLAALVAAPLLVTAIGLPAYAEERTSSVSGVGFFDLNGDGQQQPDEPGAAGFRVSLGLTSDGSTLSVVTDENGYYRFADLTQKGKYSVQFDGAGHVHTTPWAVGGSLGEGGVDVIQNFGIQ
ncbi:SdrD B-like domain-containing protein [Saccharopolyspora shandongensis]|uniref:SdrD B-like domain-containing protein n=1 Tax=Saccharopolyspora shandongensis TaxID=418495 RepID=UPI0033CA3568